MVVEGASWVSGYIIDNEPVEVPLLRSCRIQIILLLYSNWLLSVKLVVTVVTTDSILCQGCGITFLICSLDTSKYSTTTSRAALCFEGLFTNLNDFRRIDIIGI